MTKRQFQFVPDEDDNADVEPRLTLVPMTDTENAGNPSAGTDIPSGAEAAPSPVNSFSPPLCYLLGELRGLFCKYATFSTPAQPTALALWVIHTYLFEAANYTPYIYVRAPEKRSGKSRVLDIANLVAHNPFKMDSPSAAAIYAVANEGYTLHLDELDTVFGGKGGRKNENARAALNAGFERGGKIARFSQKKDELVTEYNVFCPKLLSGIGYLPPTIADRSIEIRMERRSTETRLPRFREEDVKVEVAPLNAVLAKLHDSPELIAILTPASPGVPDELSDRQMDIAEPLLAIADLAGNGWGAIAREALVELFTADQCGEESLGVTLLTDIQTVFGRDIKLSTMDLLARLIALEIGSPWAEKWESKMRADQVSTCANQLARLLKPYKIAPKQIRFGTENVKGYERVAFTDVWARYCLASEQDGVAAEPADQPAAQKPVKPERRRAPHRRPRKVVSISNMFRGFPGNGRASGTSA
ncbi:MAG: DUF3631 domain-containing protein [Terrimicrobiaceae bacterium]